MYISPKAASQNIGTPFPELLECRHIVLRTHVHQGKSREQIFLVAMARQPFENNTPDHEDTETEPCTPFF